MSRRTSSKLFRHDRPGPSDGAHSATFDSWCSATRTTEVYRALIARARSVLEDREVLHTFDIRGTKHANLFTVATGVDYETPLTVANSEVIAEGATIVPAGGASRIVISANYAVSTASAPVAPSTRRFNAAAS